MTSNVDYCVLCGAVIPEGTLYCRNCWNKYMNKEKPIYLSDLVMVGTPCWIEYRIDYPSNMKVDNEDGMLFSGAEWTGFELKPHDYESLSLNDRISRYEIEENGGRLVVWLADIKWDQ